MKIGIITFHRALNYGALLQAFALRYSLEKLGADANLLDYRNDTIEEAYVYPSFFQRKSIKDKLKYIIQGKNEKKRRFKFEAFRNKYLNLSDKIYTHGDLVNAEGAYDKFITGSDQVWNYGAHNFDKSFFLDFVTDKSKKYSYAASFGFSSLPAEYTDEYRNLLTDFACCSTRESHGSNILDQLGVDQRRIDIDPSMLLTKEEWKEQLNITDNNSSKYIFVYSFELTDTLCAFINQLAAKTGCYVLLSAKPIFNPFTCKLKALKAADPIDFVRAIANAEYVVTNSFHGTAFSIIFNKKFYVELLKTGAKVNSRLENVLHTFSLENRLINSENISDEVDWEAVNSKMNSLRNISIDYLKEIIND